MAYNIRQTKKKQYAFWPILYVMFFFFGTTLAISTMRIGSHYFTQQKEYAQKELQLKQEKNTLQHYAFKIKQAQTEAYIEDQARRLELARSNETIVVGTFPTPTPTPTPIVTPALPVYRQWYNLFVL